MIEVVPGIYSFGRELVNPQFKPLVLVHPWFFESFSKDARQVKKDFFRRGYNSCLQKLLKQYSGKANIITFEIEPKLQPTIKRVAKSAEGYYFIPTYGSQRFAQPEPLKTDWDRVAEFLHQFGNEFYFAGGQIGKRTSGNFGGCLGTTYDELLKRGITGKLVETCCFMPGKL